MLLTHEIYTNFKNLVSAIKELDIKNIQDNTEFLESYDTYIENYSSEQNAISTKQKILGGLFLLTELNFTSPYLLGLLEEELKQESPELYKQVLLFCAALFADYTIVARLCIMSLFQLQETSMYKQGNIGKQGRYHPGYSPALFTVPSRDILNTALTIDDMENFLFAKNLSGDNKKIAMIPNPSGSGISLSHDSLNGYKTTDSTTLEALVSHLAEILKTQKNDSEDHMSLSKYLKDLSHKLTESTPTSLREVIPPIINIMETSYSPLIQNKLSQVIDWEV